MICMEFPGKGGVLIQLEDLILEVGGVFQNLLGFEGGRFFILFYFILLLGLKVGDDKQIQFWHDLWW